MFWTAIVAVAVLEDVTVDVAVSVTDPVVVPAVTVTVPPDDVSRVTIPDGDTDHVQLFDAPDGDTAAVNVAVPFLPRVLDDGLIDRDVTAICVAVMLTVLAADVNVPDPVLFHDVMVYPLSAVA